MRSPPQAGKHRRRLTRLAGGSARATAPQYALTQIGLDQLMRPPAWVTRTKQ